MRLPKLSGSSFLQQVFTIAIPIALQNLLGTTASMVDTIMIGSEGQLAVAAVGICSQFHGLFSTSCSGFIIGGMLFFSQYWGAKNHAGINKAFGISFLFALSISCLFTVCAFAAPAFVLGVYTDKETIISIAIPYLRIVAFTYPLHVLSSLVISLLRTTDRVKAPLICSIVSLIVNFCLNFVLIYGRFGFPKMGATGAAIGTLIASFVNFTGLWIFFFASKCEFRFHLRQMFCFRDGFVKIYLSKSLPVVCNDMLYGIGQTLINIVIGHQAESAIAAMATFRVLEGFVFAFFGGLSDAGSVIVGKDVGAGNHSHAYRNTLKFTLLCPAITFCICLIMSLASTPLLSLFSLDSEALSYGKYMLLIYMLAGTIRTCNFIMNTCFRAGGDPLFGTVLEIAGLFLVSIPGTWIAGMVLHLPFIAVFSFVYADELIRLAFSLWHTRSGKWIKPVTAEGRAALPAFTAQLQKRTSKGKRSMP